MTPARPRYTGFVRNLDDRGEVLAIAPESKLSDLAGLLRLGPRLAEVRSVEQYDAPMQECSSFEIEP
jgi:acylphosphatase